MQKKREILPVLNKAIVALSAMHEHATKLEFTDNEQASLRFKKAIADFKTNELEDLTKCVYAVRAEINAIPPKRKRNASERTKILADFKAKNLNLDASTQQQRDALDI